MTYRELLTIGTALLEQVILDDAETDAAFLLEGAAGLCRQELLLKSGKEVPADVQECFMGFINRRAAHEPVQYILGEWEFMGLEFKVSPSVLIPRQDTETLVELCLEDLKKGVHNLPLSVLDLCTGSGCIAISLRKLAEEAGLPLEVTATDISGDALAVACENAKLSEVPITFRQGDLFEALPEGIEKFDIITANPPYIAESERKDLAPEITEYEPELALFDGGDGTTVYARILKDIEAYLKPNGRAYLEIGETQGDTLLAYCEKFLKGPYEAQIVRDLCGNPRVCKIVFGEKHV